MSDNPFPKPVEEGHEDHAHLLSVATAWVVTPFVAERVELLRALLHANGVPADAPTAAALLTMGTQLVAKLRDDGDAAVIDNTEIPLPEDAPKN